MLNFCKDKRWNSCAIRFKCMQIIHMISYYVVPLFSTAQIALYKVVLLNRHTYNKCFCTVDCYGALCRHVCNVSLLYAMVCMIY